MGDQVLGVITPDSPTRSCFLFCAIISLTSPNLFSESQLDITYFILKMVWGNTEKCAVLMYLLRQLEVYELVDYRRGTGNLSWRWSWRVDTYFQIIRYIQLIRGLKSLFISFVLFFKWTRFALSMKVWIACIHLRVIWLSSLCQLRETVYGYFTEVAHCVYMFKIMRRGK